MRFEISEEEGKGEGEARGEADRTDGTNRTDGSGSAEVWVLGADGVAAVWAAAFLMAAMARRRLDDFDMARLLKLAGEGR